MASDWPTRIREWAPIAQLRTGVVAVTAATLVGGGAAFAVLPSISAEPLTAVPSSNDASQGLAALTASQVDLASRGGVDRVSRDSARPEVAEAKPAALTADQKKVAEGGSLAKLTVTAKPGKAWTTTSLRVRSTASAEAKEVAVLSEGSEVTTTGIKQDGFSEITLEGKQRWVSSKYLTTTAPKVETEPAGSTSTGTSQGKSQSKSQSRSGSKSSGSSDSSSSSSAAAPQATGGSGSCRTQLPGLTSRARTLHNAICANYPSVSSYGGVRADSYPAHPSGRAIDAMIPNWQSASGNGLGWSMANWLRANAGRFGIAEIIFDQKIWTAQRSGDGWRTMSDRGSANANHRNHVHVAVK